MRLPTGFDYASLPMLSAEEVQKAGMANGHLIIGIGSGGRCCQ